jgi:transcriptional regulator with GAF, ATPase, and Fis domain
MADDMKTTPDDGSQPAVGDLLLVAGEGRLVTHALVANELVIGRAPECDVVVDHRALSRRHAVLRRAEQVTIQDLGSTNGTRTSKQVLVGGEPAVLGPGESFHIGPFTFMLVAGRTAEPSSHRSGIERLIVEDPTLERVGSLVRDVARSGSNVLIQGETGVGKEVLASTIHTLSERSGPLLRINCAALSEPLLESELFGHEKGAFTGAVSSRIGLLEAAAGGSAFLDEIGELSPNIQAKLLRAVEAREILRIGSTRTISIDVRFIAATHRDLAGESATGKFRQDLYYRLDGVTLRIPPLRERRGMIAPLAMRFLEQAALAAGKTAVRAAPELLAALEAHDWPGNVRELRAVIERALLLARGGELGVRHLVFAKPEPAAAGAPAPAPPAPPASSEDLSFFDAAQLEERAKIIAVLDACAGNQTRAAKMLGVSRSTLVNKLVLFRIPRPRQ